MYFINVMKKLILVRHAKSSWEFNMDDHKRPLKPRGYSDANLVFNTLKGKIFPDLIISSDATRAKSTAELYASISNTNKDEIILNNMLYDFSGSNLVQVVKNCKNSVNVLMIFGHNNAITNFVNTYGDVIIDNVPTCGVTIMEFFIDNWTHLNRGQTIETLFPRDLK
jgi:phosphohistidine phosphatase